MNPPIDDEPTNGIRHRRDTLRPVEDEEEPRVERRQSKSWGDLLDPKTMLLIGVAVLSGNGSKLGEMLGVAQSSQPESERVALIESEAKHAAERMGRLEQAHQAMNVKLETVERGVTTLLERVPARRQR